jgi:hypothetical protein
VNVDVTFERVSVEGNWFGFYRDVVCRQDTSYLKSVEMSFSVVKKSRSYD